MSKIVAIRIARRTKGRPMHAACCALLLVAASIAGGTLARASTPEPDNVLFGRIADEAGESLLGEYRLDGLVVEARPVSVSGAPGDPVAAYSVGARPEDGGERFVVRVPVSAQPGSGALAPGRTFALFVNGARVSDEFAAARIDGAGLFRRVELRVDPDALGIPQITPSPTPSATPTVSPSPTPSPEPTDPPDPTPSPSPTPTPDARLANLSTRGFVGADDGVMIGGLIVSGTEPRRVLLSGVGPDLANFGLSGTLANPALTLIREGEVVADNDDWTLSESAADIFATGFAPNIATEAAILATLAPGEYTAFLRGADGGTGVGLFQAFDLGGGEGRLANLSTRLEVGPEERAMIGGFILAGDAPKRVLVRSLGPTLAAEPFNVAGALADPALALLDAEANVVAENGDWTASPDAVAIEALGYAPANAAEPALLATLPAGAYTAVVFSAEGTPGVALVEVYEMPEEPVAGGAAPQGALAR